jgi:hypothetical protein
VFKGAPFLDDGDFHGPDVPQWQGRVAGPKEPLHNAVRCPICEE